MTRRPVLPGASELFRRTDSVASASEVTELPTSPSSLAWYRGWRDHLGYATINPDAADPGPGVMGARP